MNLRAEDTTEETPAPAIARAYDVLDNILPFALKRDFIQLLLQSPHRLYLYWTFARDPHQTLREAFGELAAHYRLSVRLVRVETGEEFVLDAPRERAQWFEVYPSHVYRAEVGFHAPGRPFVRLLSSNAVTTPPDRASHLSDAQEEFQLEADEFAQLLGGAAYERYARPATEGAGQARVEGGSAVTPSAAERREHLAIERREAHPPARHVSPLNADEYPHR